MDSLAQISRVTPKRAMEASVWRCYSLSYRATFRTLNTMAKAAIISMKQLMEAEATIGGAFDNFQLIQRVKFQNDGRLSREMKGTVCVARRHFPVPPTVGSIIAAPNGVISSVVDVQLVDEYTVFLIL